jgi:uncharacterized protein
MTSTPPRRVVIDPNVLVSTAITPAGDLRRILTLSDLGTLTPIVTEHLVDEVADVLGRPKFRRYVDVAGVEEFLAEIRRLGEWHSDPIDPPKVCRDPDDDYLLALAIASRADALVTGDNDLHAVPNPGVEVITPRELLYRIPSSRGVEWSPE